MTRSKEPSSPEAGKEKLTSADPDAAQSSGKDHAPDKKSSAGPDRINQWLPSAFQRRQVSPEIREATTGVSGFVDHLLHKNIVTRKMVHDALEIKKAQNNADKRQLFQILIEELDVDRELVYAEFAHYYSFKTIDLGSVQVDADRFAFMSKTLELVPSKIRDLMLANKILPFQLAENDPAKLQFVTPDPTNAEISTITRAFPYAKHEICYVSLLSFEELSRELLVDTQNKPSVQSVDFIDDDQGSALDDLDEEIRKGHLNELVDNILGDAVRVNASDIHVIPRGPRITAIYFRLDGKLSLWQTIDDLRADAVAAVIKDLAKGADRFERNTAQDGFAQKMIDNRIIRFRVSTIPLVGRELKVKLESIVMRVLRDPEASITVENIGFQAFAMEQFRKAIEKPHGIVILTGPTGSGKSTTLLAALRAVMDPSLNVITVEDPVEYLIDGARQVKLSPKLGFEEALRAILRHDPDIVMVGEIRDRQTADLAIKLANTGHLTFSTVHTNDAPSVVARFYKMGVEPFLLAYAVNIIVAQRLVRKLCERCKIRDEEISPKTLERLGIPVEVLESATFYKPVGCLHCLQGYKGRVAIHEVLYFTREIRDLIMESASSINEHAIRKTAISQGMQTLREAGIELVKKGVTSLEEIASSTISD